MNYTEIIEDLDFSVAPFWITTDSGDEPLPILNENDLRELGI